MQTSIIGDIGVCAAALQKLWASPSSFLRMSLGTEHTSSMHTYTGMARRTCDVSVTHTLCYAGTQPSRRQHPQARVTQATTQTLFRPSPNWPRWPEAAGVGLPPCIPLCSAM